ncbi:mycofactocin biosynthesis peptidyl-dipeptidase MftE [uncultured Williamsia sp.]|uniref:mycofactocin biosynthesis peptidyl-dipeptidase MftE n=1 Tax=uncultured Williamsia sp. TaxID=259311 RepID=UPI0026136D03|nr:mycofactocin biosynthesis peptidyl-dipeptidase MftE [uncultured Williamsia sp.]
MTRPGGLGGKTWPELDDRRCTVVVPLGALEQHGPHLPLDTDTRIAETVAGWAVERLVADGHEAMTAPSLAYGASGEHEGFPGTVSIGHDALRLLLVEFGRSVCRWAARLLIVNAHGGNAHTVVDAVALLRSEGRDVAWWACTTPGADAHAGLTETSVLLAISPGMVMRDKVAVGATAPIGDLMDSLRAGGVRAVSANGVLGDPRPADDDQGRRIVEDMVDRLAAATRRWLPDERGGLA